MVAFRDIGCYPAMGRALSLTLLVGLISLGCSPKGLIPPEKGGPADREVRHYIPDVPFFPQSTFQCGPAALASVLNYYGCPVTPGEIAKAIYSERLRGTLSIDLILFAQRMEFNASPYSGSLADLKGHIGRNHPLIVFQDLGYPLLPIHHFSVVIGYDETRGILILHSGKRRNKTISYERFLRSWAKMDFWTLLILPP
jgi:ABC-type bacteriocin/lantibiotic exporter with double-glycine peptidase domain